MPFSPTLADLDGAVGRIHRSWTGKRSSLDGLTDYYATLYERAIGCHGRPPRRTATIPRPSSCEPYEFKNEGHFESTLLKFSGLREIDVLRSETRVLSRFIPTEHDVLRPRDPSPRDDVAPLAISGVVLAEVRKAVRERFRLGEQVRYQTEIRISLLELLDVVEDDPVEDVRQAFRDLLGERHPELFGYDDDGMKAARNRAVKYAFGFLREALAHLDPARDADAEGDAAGEDPGSGVLTPQR